MKYSRWLKDRTTGMSLGKREGYCLGSADAWLHQKKQIEEFQAKIEDALFDMNQRKLELCESCDGYKDPVGVCQSEGLEIAINILKQALKGGEV